MDISKFSIGATAGIITSMGLIAGLTQGYNAKVGIITGLLIVAIADNVSDAFSFHVYKESEGASRRDVSSSTFENFASRLLLVFTFILIVLLFSPYTALIISSIWGLVLLTILSYLIAKNKRTSLLPQIFLHLIIALSVIAGSKLLGNLILKIVNGS
jgi:4-hydroxybenzoate polyprenyltransferase